MKTRLYFLTAALIMSLGVYSQTEAKPVIVDPVTQCAYRFFYYPNIEAYFDSKENVYLYQDKGQWIEANEIPSGYRGYSIYNKVNVVIDDYDDDNPTQFLAVHKKKYPYNKGRHREVASIRTK